MFTYSDLTVPENAKFMFAQNITLRQNRENHLLPRRCSPITPPPPSVNQYSKITPPKRSPKNNRYRNRITSLIYQLQNGIYLGFHLLENRSVHYFLIKDDCVIHQALSIAKQMLGVSTCLKIRCLTQDTWKDNGLETEQAGKEDVREIQRLRVQEQRGT